ncbi:hypothetical protein HDV06_001973 [Boothiomyces sp. JEL0866]|nr:hypothetical protein HDV06_001973 [Boothiomyces sp. JEL0866]
MGKLLKQIKKLFKSNKQAPVVDIKPLEPVDTDTDDIYDIATQLRSRLSLDSGKSAEIESPSEKYCPKLQCFFGEELPAYTEDDSPVLSDMKSIYSFYQL